jgi:hypothetical protein
MIPITTGMIQLKDIELLYKKFEVKPGYGEWAGKNSNQEYCYCPMTLLFLINNDAPKIFKIIADWVEKNYGNYGLGFLAGWDGLNSTNINLPYVKGYEDGQLFRKKLNPERIGEDNYDKSDISR